MKEKLIEKEIVNYLKELGAWIEQLQAGKVLIKKGPYNNMMHLCTPGTPDIICLYRGFFYAIEVKKNKEEYDKWLKVEQRLENEGVLPKYLKREQAQIEHKKLIIENGGIHILCYELAQIQQYLQDN